MMTRMLPMGSSCWRSMSLSGFSAISLTIQGRISCEICLLFDPLPVSRTRRGVHVLEATDFVFPEKFVASVFEQIFQRQLILNFLRNLLPSVSGRFFKSNWFWFSWEICCLRFRTDFSKATNLEFLEKSAAFDFGPFFQRQLILNFLRNLLPSILSRFFRGNWSWIFWRICCLWFLANFSEATNFDFPEKFAAFDFWRIFRGN